MMGNSKNCKHEAINVNWERECFECRFCGVHLADDIEIVRAKPHQLMQDVVKAGREMSEYMMKRIDRNFNIAGTDDLGELW
ncbi:MAG TPA: hypothetical protein ENI07_25475, partial [Desulfobacterales bacterium]|nr:hypothetical protein [Desulfobacterales bacterium]